MERDFLIISVGAAVAFFVASNICVSSGISPANVPRMHTTSIRTSPKT
jgi:hypothetical protein